MLCSGELKTPKHLVQLTSQAYRFQVRHFYNRAMRDPWPVGLTNLLLQGLYNVELFKDQKKQSLNSQFEKLIRYLTSNFPVNAAALLKGDEL